MFGIKPTAEYLRVKQVESQVAYYKREQRKYERRLWVLKALCRPAYELKATRYQIDFARTMAANWTNDLQNAVVVYQRSTR